MRKNGFEQGAGSRISAEGYASTCSTTYKIGSGCTAQALGGNDNCIYFPSTGVFALPIRSGSVDFRYTLLILC